MLLRRHTSASPAPLRRVAPAVLCLAGLGLAGLAGGLLAPAAPAHAGTPGAAGSVVSAVSAVPSAKAVLGYWTQARLRAAKPAGLLVAGTGRTIVPATAKPAGKPGRVPGGTGLAAPASAGGISPRAFPYPYPYDSFFVPPSLVPTYPYSVNGKLFFANNGGNWVCSATSVASASGTANENEIWTAGHCLVNTSSNNQVKDSSAVFIPAYNGSVANYDPFGTFVWNGGYTVPTAWYSGRDLTEDEAAMTVGTSTTTGRTLGQAVGWDGFAWNQSVNQQFIAFGYPAESPYNGSSLVEDVAATAGQDGQGGANPVHPVVIGDPMTGGSSGGAWNISWSPTGPGYIDGHNDYIYTNQPSGMYSPYQDTLSNMVRCFSKASC